MLTINDAHVRFNQGTPDEVHALRGVNLQLNAGDFATIVGSNGAGKSTLANVIAGSIPLASGRVSVAGSDVTRQADFRRARRIARVFADPLVGTVGDMTIEDNVSLAMARTRKRGMSRANTRAKRAKIVAAIAHLGLGLENRLGEDVRRLSSGQRQSLTMAMAVVCAPQVLILDEHLSALDPVTKDRLTELTMECARSSGCAAIMVTHSMNDAIRLGTHLLVMSSGQIVARFEGVDKQSLTVSSLLARIAGSGVTLSDRSVLDGLGG